MANVDKLVSTLGMIVWLVCACNTIMAKFDKLVLVSSTFGVVIRIECAYHTRHHMSVVGSFTFKALFNTTPLRSEAGSASWALRCTAAAASLLEGSERT